jgi:hypothetical protein
VVAHVHQALEKVQRHLGVPETWPELFQHRQRPLAKVHLMVAATFGGELKRKEAAGSGWPLA